MATLMNDTITFGADAKPPVSVMDSLGKFLTVITAEGKVLQVNARHKQYNAAREAYLSQNWSKLFGIMTPIDAIQNRRWQGEGVTVVGDELTFNGEVINDKIADAIFSLVDEGKDPLPIVKFLVRAYKMPEMYEGYKGDPEQYQKAVAAFAESRKALFEYVAKGGLHFTDRGTVLGYKSVRGIGTTKYIDGAERELEPLTDWYSGKFRNYIGVPVTMDPKDADPSRYSECGRGFHIGTWGYASTFNTSGSYIILLCEFEPEHVVSVKSDGSQGKLRVFRYVPVEIYTDNERRGKDPLPGTVYMSQMFDRTGLYDILAPDPDGAPLTPTPVGTYVGDSADEDE